MVTEPDNHLGAVREALAEQAEQVAVALLGAPQLSRPGEVRFGRHGSLSLSLTGAKAGLYYDHEVGKGGDMLALIQRETGKSFKDALAWARHFLGLSELDAGPPIATRHPDSLVHCTGRYAERRDPDGAAEAARNAERAAQAAKRAETEAQDAAKQEGRRRIARRFWDGAEAIDWTPGDLYLREARRITGHVEFPHSAVRYHSGLRALIAAATDEAGEIVGVQIVRLTKNGHKRPPTAARPTKQSFGAIGRGVIRLPARHDCGYSDVLLVAEGVETGLTAWAATGAETWVSLGSTTRLTLPKNRLVMSLRDDDPPQSPAAKAARKAIAAWRASGVDVVGVFPWPIRRGDKSDFNDLAQRDGMAVVRQRIAEAIATALARVECHLPSVDEARRMVAEQVEAALTRRTSLGLTPIATGVQACVGTGKTEAVLHQAVRFLARLRAEGDKGMFVTAVPTHGLSDELVKRAEIASGGALRARIWRGREALDPASEGETMCKNIARVREAQALALDPFEAVCEVGCPFRSRCSYLIQLVGDADLLIVAHAALFGPLPKPLRGREVAAVVVDESAWQAGLVGVGAEPVTLPLDALASGAMPVPRGLPAHEVTALQTRRHRAVKDGAVDEAAKIDEMLATSQRRQADGERLTALREGLHAALLANGFGPLRRDVLARHPPFNERGLGGNEGVGPLGNRLEWARKVQGTLEDEDGGDGELAANRSIAPLLLIWDAVDALLIHDGDAASGWLELAIGKDGTRQIVIRGRRAIHDDYAVRTVLIDADLDEVLSAPFWPDLVVGPRIEAATPFMRLRQVFDRSFGKSTIEPLTARQAHANPKEAVRRMDMVKKLRRFIISEHHRTGGKTLVATYKRTAVALEKLGLPNGIEFTWFGALRGRDTWRDVRTLIVAGRPLPGPADVEALAMALSGEAVQRIDGSSNRGWYPDRDTPRLIQGADGLARIVTTEAPAHPDELAEHIRQQVADGEVAQAIGRGRAVNRHAGSPLNVVVLSDALLPIPVKELDAGTVMHMAPVDAMLAEGGVALESPADAARAYPELWQSGEAAKKALQRGGRGHSRIDRHHKRMSPSSITYQISGAGQKLKRGIFMPAIVPDPRSWLEARLGPLVSFKIVEPDAVPGCPTFLPGDDAPDFDSADPPPELCAAERPSLSYEPDVSIEDLSPDEPGLILGENDNWPFPPPLEADWAPERDP